MTGSKWGLTGIDTSEGVIHVEEQMEATLEVFQDCDKSPGPIKLCKFLLKGPAPKAGEDVPWGLAWVDEEAHLCGPIHLKLDPVAKVVQYAREQPPNLLVRSTGGKDHEKDEKDKPLPERLRGGYVFAPAELADPDLLGPAGVKKDRMVASVDLILAPANKQHHRLYFFHPAPARQLWMYDEHTFKLSFVLTSGDKTWRADGPTIKVPAYEFINDSGKSDTLKENLQLEYGDPAKKPPLHARDYIDLLTGLSPISIALRNLLPLGVDWINGKIPSGSKYTLKTAEIACAFLNDKVVETLKSATSSPQNLLFSSHDDIGIDRLIDAYQADEGPIRVFTFDQLHEMLAVGRGVAHLVDKQSEVFKPLDNLPLPLALYAVAALYGQAKHFFAKDLEDPAVMGKWAMPIDELPLHVQFFWSCIYYAGGLDNGKATLARRGVEYHDLEWPFEDDQTKYARYEKYNANWRTASFRVLQLSLGLPGLPGMGLPSVDLLDSIPGL